MLYIIRHGRTEQNEANRLQGRRDTPLNETGIHQAESAGELFRGKNIVFDRIYSSPLTRAMDTARLVSPDTEIITDERLLEMDYGPYEGCDLNYPPAEIIEFFSDFVHNKAPEGMEQLSSVTRRLGSFLEEIKAYAENHTVLVSTHAIAMKGALEYLTPKANGKFWSQYIGNCAVWYTSVVNGQYTVPEELK